MVIMIIIMIVRDYLLRYEKEIHPVPLHVQKTKEKKKKRRRRPLCRETEDSVQSPI